MRPFLLFYKKSAYEIYCLERQGTFASLDNPVVRQKIKIFQKVHEEHYAVLQKVETILRNYNLPYKKCHRGQAIGRNAFDWVITIGGDGTVLEAARQMDRQVLLGVNSSPGYSVGRLCVATVNNFESILRKILENKITTKYWHRLKVLFPDQKTFFYALNDVLICHLNPAAMSRYILSVKGRKEEQRSSGLWVATPTGSSGGIYSAGGVIVPETEKRIQYLPRELYQAMRQKYCLTGEVLATRQRIAVTSLMREGKIFVDGSHVSFAFPLGQQIRISMANHPIKTVSV